MQECKAIEQAEEMIFAGYSNIDELILVRGIDSKKVDTYTKYILHDSIYKMPQIGTLVFEEAISMMFGFGKYSNRRCLLIFQAWCLGSWQ
jgi:hypothetical protein